VRHCTRRSWRSGPGLISFHHARLRSRRKKTPALSRHGARSRAPWRDAVGRRAAEGPARLTLLSPCGPLMDRWTLAKTRAMLSASREDRRPLEPDTRGEAAGGRLWPSNRARSGSRHRIAPRAPPREDLYFEAPPGTASRGRPPRRDVRGPSRGGCSPPPPRRFPVPPGGEASPSYSRKLSSLAGSRFHGRLRSEGAPRLSNGPHSLRCANEVAVAGPAKNVRCVPRSLVSLQYRDRFDDDNDWHAPMGPRAKLSRSPRPDGLGRPHAVASFSPRPLPPALFPFVLLATSYRWFCAFCVAALLPPPKLLSGTHTVSFPMRRAPSR